MSLGIAQIIFSLAVSACDLEISNPSVSVKAVAFKDHEKDANVL